ncbi:DUF305 domain-containing protein [Prauserella marina]|uniref:Uncharacterized conserved protein, DUF305 family n=1 Tax=Prauserella marina TaxID=530584 RepID=A0A222VV46_9PSEU|nr:DUF305 domain-containing protein [Prauserella marina]ASR37816.1 DUF305 domain-containing protein [Prauserella marina]PWV75775.1 uncharacterized protein (DUF305 family) [Prauserella marina]SDD26482.1 Uncharacterized conserved protein, DUF305 family [Prauserella marina]
MTSPNDDGGKADEDSETAQPEPAEGGSTAVVTEEPIRPTWSRYVIFGAATLAVLLVGATIGMLLTQSKEDPGPATPDADSVEVGFAQDMSVHHLQAVTMANWARDHSTTPAINQLAFDIASTQEEQVGRMKGWLMLWNQPEQAIGPYMTWMEESGGHAHAGGTTGTAPTTGGAPMPGMATESELSKLRSLSGEELDVYFLQLMLRHHEGGTEMAQYTYDHSSTPAVRALTKSILDSQGTEIILMQQLLAQRGATPLPFP